MLLALIDCLSWLSVNLLIAGGNVISGSNTTFMLFFGNDFSFLFVYSDEP